MSFHVYTSSASSAGKYKVENGKGNMCGIDVTKTD